MTKGINNAKPTNQRIEMIALANMEPDSGYQRPTNPDQVAHIVNTFKEAKLGVITVSMRDGKYHILDGGHRTKALRALGYTHALCVVLTGLTYSQEADFFSGQNDGMRPLRPADLFRAGLAAGDEKCVRINNVVKANGFQVGSGNKGFYRIFAINALYRIVGDYGYEVLDDTLCLIANTWAGIAKASQYESLLGVVEFVHRYGMVDFADRMREKFAAVWYEYTNSMSVHGSISSGLSRKKYCRVLVEQYNRGLNGNSKKRLKWEG